VALRFLKFINRCTKFLKAKYILFQNYKGEKTVKSNRSRLKLLTVLLAGSLAVQSFDCASPEYTTAKVAITKRDWAKAEESLQKELAKNPTNAEAWFDLHTVRRERGDVAGMIEALTKAEQHAKTDELKKKLGGARLNAWVEAYNSGINAYTRYSETQSTASLDTAQQFINSAISLKPDYPETYSFYGRLLEMSRDTAKAIEAYNSYARLQQPVMDFLAQNSLYSGSSRETLLQSAGKPASTMGRSTGTAGDSVVIDVFKINNQDVYAFSVSRGGKPFELQGMRINPPASWLQQEKERMTTFDVSPYSALASVYYDRKNYDLALENLNRLLVLDPANENAMNSRIQIYQDQNRTDEAIRSLADVVQKNPNNKMTRTQYGTLLLKLNRFDEAMAQYEAALQIDPNHDAALFNLAAAYKNKAGVIQNEEKAKLEKDSKYKVNESLYTPLLNKAAEYFEHYRNIPGRGNDFRTLLQLANIYEVTNNKTKLNTMIAEMESLESQYSTDYAYYESLGQLYMRQNQTDKATRAFEKADRLKK
jgi:tetratricopeptide (TPR) repeat protein